MDELIAGTRAIRAESTRISQTVDFLGSGSADGHFTGNASFPLQAPDPANPLAVTTFGDYAIAALNSIPLLDALDAPGVLFTQAGEAPWLGELSAQAQDGVDQAGSGPIGDSQSSSMSTTVAGPGTLTFRWKVSSQVDGDYLQLLDNGNVIRQIRRNQAYTLVTYPVPAGLHTISWRYVEDGAIRTGSDRGWVDQVDCVADPPHPCHQRHGRSGYRYTATSGLCRGRCGHAHRHAQLWQYLHRLGGRCHRVADRRLTLTMDANKSVIQTSGSGCPPQWIHLV